MARGLQKTPFRCPACGFSQIEPAGLISTFCRSCGEHFQIVRNAGRPPVLPPLPPASTATKRTVFCHKCRTSHPVSTSAQSTICPACGAGIELGDLSFSSPASRPVDIRGKLTIGPAGSLSSSWIICGAARIQGRIIGRLIAEGEVRVATSQTCACHITAPLIVIEKRASPVFLYPLQTERLVVFGRLTGIVHCGGVVHVERGGRLDAEVHARSVIVDKGGSLVGDCRVADADRTDSPGLSWTGHLCPAR
ncbi:MAG: polymer-forming cytoskeletal protein [Verrucomicrobiae bacterium]